MNRDDHQRLREMLGSYALGHLDPADTAMVRAHLDGCAECRTDLEEIAPLAGLLDLVDAVHFDAPPGPPVGLGESIRHQVAAERRTREADELAVRRAQARRRAAVRVGLVAAAVVLLAGSLVGGLAIGRSTAPTAAPPPSSPTTPVSPTSSASSAPPVPLEPVDLQPVDLTGLDVDTAGLVAHTWGVELRMTATGFRKGRVFQAAFRDRRTGELVMAGAFIGTGDTPMTCNLQSALFRDDASQVVILDQAGDVVLTASI